MALNAYLTLEGPDGPIDGSVTQAGREDSIMVIAFDHTIQSPRDAASGLPSGKRQHGPLTIAKEIDKSSPLLQKALSRNSGIKTFKLDFWEPTMEGLEFQYYTIELENASISKIKQQMLNNKTSENMPYREYEEVSFCYQKIIWTFQDGGITAEDDWETPVV